MWKWLIRFLSVAYVVKRWKQMPPWARALIAMALVLTVSIAILAIFGLLRYVAKSAGLGWIGVAAILGLTVATGLYFGLDIPGRRARAKRASQARAADKLLQSLPGFGGDDPEKDISLDDPVAVQDRLRALLRQGRLDEAEALLTKVQSRFGKEAWWAAFERQIALRR